MLSWGRDQLLNKFQNTRQVVFCAFKYEKWIKKSTYWTPITYNLCKMHRICMHLSWDVELALKFSINWMKHGWNFVDVHLVVFFLNYIDFTLYLYTVPLYVLRQPKNVQGDWVYFGWAHLSSAIGLLCSCFMSDVFHINLINCISLSQNHFLFYPTTLKSRQCTKDLNADDTKTKYTLLKTIKVDI